MFEITVRRKFMASHALTNADGSSEKTHEHEFAAEIKIASKKLDESGCAVDFRDVDSALDEVMGGLEGKTLHETENFSNLSSSAENIAKYIFDSLSGISNFGITSVTVWEDLDHGASFIKD